MSKPKCLIVDNDTHTFVSIACLDHEEVWNQLQMVGADMLYNLHMPVDTDLDMTLWQMPGGWKGETDNDGDFHYLKDAAGHIRVRIVAGPSFFSTVVFTRFRPGLSRFAERPVVYDLQLLSQDINAEKVSEDAGIIWKGPDKPLVQSRHEKESAWADLRPAKAKLVLDNTKFNLPPLGVMPREIWLKLRKQALEEAIVRYREAGIDDNPAWADNLAEVVMMLKDGDDKTDVYTLSESHKLAENWLDATYPCWRDPAAYWDEPAIRQTNPQEQS